MRLIARPAFFWVRHGLRCREVKLPVSATMASMRVALVRPNYKTHLITPPLGLGYLSSYVKSKRFDCEIVDGLKLGLTNEELTRRCSEADLVGISLLSSYFRQVIDLTAKLHKKGKLVVIGGAMATAVPKLVLKETKADFVAVGEGEITLYQLLRELKIGKKLKEIKIRGLVSRYQPKFVPRPFITHLSGLPIPDWLGMDPRTYPKAPHGGVVKHFPVAPIVTTRGCPYECKFCASPAIWQRQIRFREPAEVVEEIKYLVNNFGVKEIHFEDDNFTFRREHAEAVCRLIIKNKLNISWATPNGIRADKVDLPLLRLMKKAGCYFVAFGIESGNQEILNNVAKHSDLHIIAKAVKMANRVGLITQGFFIFGLPGETKETIEETIRLAKNLPLDKAQFLLLDVIPGSALWQELKFNKKVNWNLDSYHEVSWCPPTIDREILQQAQSKAFKAFFLRPKQAWEMVKMIKPSQLKYVVKRLIDFRIGITP
jgi:anaerobic magnesium-protoporphyrin IX monomethyl ester cyclase